MKSHNGSDIGQNELSREVQQQLMEKIGQVFSGEPVKDPPAWELTITLQSGKQVKAELRERDAQLLGEWLGIKLLENTLVKGPFMFARVRGGNGS